MSSLEKIKLRPYLIGLLLLQIVGVIYYACFFYGAGYLPAPFIYDKSDTFMDFFHVMYWSNEPGRYTEWQSVYPPINFLFMKIVGWLFLGNADFVDGFDIRGSSVGLQCFIVVSYLVMPAVAMASDLWRNFSRQDKRLLYFIWVLSTPVLFGMERGNLLIFCLPFLALALTQSRFRLLAIAILINIKPYFALFILAPVAALCWSDMIVLVMLAGAIFVFSGLLLDPNFLYFLQNLIDFGQSDTVFSGREVLSLPSSVAAFPYAFLAALNAGLRSRIDFSFVGHIVSYANLIVILGTLVSVFLAGRRLTQQQITGILLVMTSNLGVWVGGYSMAFYLLLIPLLVQFRVRKFCWLLIFLIFSPLDLVVLFHETLPVQPRFLSGSVGPVEYLFGLGSLLRPALNLALLALLGGEAFYMSEFSPLKSLNIRKVVVE